MRINLMMIIALNARKKDNSIVVTVVSGLFISHVSIQKDFQNFGIVNTAYIGIFVFNASSLNHRPKKNMLN